MSALQRWLLRLLVPLGLAAFGAVMCAGPGTEPFTAQLAQPLICPPRTTLVHEERPGTDSDGNSVTYVSLNCVGDDGFRQSADGRAFLVLGGIYFVVFFAAMLAVWFGYSRTARGGPPPRPLGVDGLRQVEALLAQDRRLDAIRIVRQQTGANLRQAKDYVETLATPPPGGPGWPPPPRPDAVAELAQLKSQLEAGQITVQEYPARAADISMRL
jgi:hypothetical protein